MGSNLKFICWGLPWLLFFWRRWASSCHFRLTWTFFLGCNGHIDVGLLSDHRLCDSLSFHRFHGEICKLFELQVSHTMGMKHVISQLSHRVTHVKKYQCANFLFHNSDTTLCVSCFLLSYAGLVLCIVWTPASLSCSPTLRLNGTIELSPSVRTITSG